MANKKSTAAPAPEEEKISQDRAELEYSIVGAMIHDREVTGRLLPILTRADFAQEALGTVFDALRQLFNTNAPIDRLTVLQQCGDDYHELLEAALAHRAMPSNAEYYAAMLRDRARTASISAAALELALLPETEHSAVPDILSRINALSVTRSQWQGVTMSDAVTAFFDLHGQDKKTEFLDFGFHLLNRKLYCEPGDFIILAGEPSSGKTALAAQMAFSLAEKHRVGFFTLETSSAKLTDRMMARASGVPLAHIKENQLTDIEWEKLARTANLLQHVQIEQIPASGMTVSDIRSYSLARHYDVIIVDYLQIIKPANPRAGRYEQVTQISIDLHTAAQENHITILALAQLSRPEKSKKKPEPPSMHDLKESGQIEQDADAVLLLYNKDRNSYTCNRILKIGKNKEGERDTFELGFDGATQTFNENPPDADDQHIRRHAKPYKDTDDSKVFHQNTFDELDDHEPLPF